ncbi:DNA replication regulator SLD2 [Cordyceps javanica]|uniref:DNA replication regulator SLD2 n=1 Tax=Cordyceps javanica TaxID=43265 RepID=A0A545URV4_9HYPO|nr:DNA replication regulator SLD2 [Cordyceps javanica]TQW04011.1 DNA replication regulator SLD2 [Cordyceps javanica]
MDDKAKASYERKSKELRADLKKWESEWAGAHDGTKPGRQDIKENPSIAAKYKEYNKTRDILAGRIPVPTTKEQQSNPKKRRPDPPPAETPLKKNKYAETPIKNRTLDEDQFMSTPAISRKLFSPAPVTSIGPTPQRDGKVLGLFDMLVDKELGTPSKNITDSRLLAPSTPGRRRRNSEVATPSRRSGSMDTEAKLGRTPMSSSKRHMLNTFMTPLKKKDDIGTGGKTPTSGSVSKLQFDTPAFLRRHTLPALDGETAFDAPAPLRLPRKPLGRGLSEIVASLRKVEDDNLDDDDDMAALREAEAADMGSSTRAATAPPGESSAAVAAAASKESEILARDHDAAHLPLGGFDDEGLYDSPDEADPSGRNGHPQVVYKKKGQKRTTRRVNMRPTITKRPSAPLGDSQDMVVPETQPDGQENADGGEFEDGAAASEGTAGRKPPAKEGVVKKSVRKVNELAHANFRRLKLRSKNPKGKPGGFSRRFGRR